MTAPLQTILTELRERLEALYGERLDRLMLFGSQARGDAEPDSDIDVLVVLKGEVRPGQEILRTGEIKAELSLKYDCLISGTYVSADAYANSGSGLLQNARREGVTV